MTTPRTSPRITIIQGDSRHPTDRIPDKSIHCIVTSPPYWGLRDYGTATWEGGAAECDHQVGIFDSKRGDRQRFSGHDKRPGSECGKCGAKRIDAQIGLEPTPEAFVASMVEVFREAKRCLRDDGTLWLNLGDSYCSTAPGTKNAPERIAGAGGRDGGRNQERARQRPETPTGLKPKDLCGIPWRVAFALQADGWYLRQWMPWVKRNAMPESVTDRPATSCEIIFLLTKSERYFYDGEAVKMPSAPASAGRMAQDIESQTGSERANGGRKTNGNIKAVGDIESGRNRRQTDWFLESNWQGMVTDDDGFPVAMLVNPQPFKGAHFATFPPKLVQPCILAGTSARGCCPTCGAPWERVTESTGIEAANHKGSRFDQGKTGERDGGDRTQEGPRYTKATTRWEPSCTCFHLPGHAEPIPCRVLDPFLGSGTTAQVALELGRDGIGRELNPEYIGIADQRTNTTPGFAF